MPNISNDDVKIYRPKFTSYKNTLTPVSNNYSQESNTDIKLYNPVDSGFGKIWVDDNKK